MKYINPNDLNGARVYFTGFDSQSYITQNKDERLNILQRTLKVLLLTKNKIVFGASHLKGDLAKEILEQAPFLFENNLLLPALRNEHNGNLENAINGKNDIDLKGFNCYVGWDLEDNTTWFQEKILEGFKYQNSLLRNNIQFTTNHKINEIIEKLEKSKYFDRDSSNIITSLLNKNDLQFYKRYQNLVYNISGSRVVNCESSLDQENMNLDYSLTDIENKKTTLSEVEIFHRIFIEQVLNTLHRNNTLFNISFIDALTFKDIVDLRERIEQSSFIEKYNRLVNKSSQTIMKNDYIDFYSLQEILQLSDEIHLNFNKDIEKEAETYLKRQKRYDNEKKIWEPVYNIIKSFNPVSSTLDQGKNLIYFTRNLYNVMTDEKDKNIRQDFLEKQTSIAKNLLQSAELENSTALVETVKLLRQYLFEKYENF